MKALTESSVVGEPLAGIYQRLATLVAEHSRGALEAAEVGFQQAPEHTGGDLSFPCFPLARAWKRNPAQIATEMASLILEDERAADLLDGAEAAGPYLNLRLARTALARQVLEAITVADGAYGDSHRQEGDIVMMEYVSPNTNKPLHIGHVRNALVGRTVANLIESQGAQMHRTDIINDRGIHIAKSMLAYDRFGNGDTPESTGIKGDHFVGKYYVKFDQALKREREQWLEKEDIDPDALKELDELAKKKVQERFLAESELMAETRDILQKWEAEDEEVRALWRKMNGWVYDGFGQTYDRLGIVFDKHYYESDVYQGGREVIMEALEAGTFERADNGAIVAPLSKLEGQKLQDKVVIRGDGTGLYITQDINLATIKFEEFGLNRSYYCIGSEQNYYMRQLKATLGMLGFPWAEGMEHLSYGMVYLPDGRMKSREGNVVDADDLMVEMTSIAAKEVRDRSDELDDGEVARRAEAIGLAAIVFSLLVVGRETDIHFDPDKAVAFEGKTGPYLQYAYARISRILKKAGEFEVPAELDLQEDAAWSLVRGLLFYPTAVADAAESLDPSRLTAYLTEQTQALSAFYRDLHVLNAEEPQRSSRLALLAAFRSMLGHAFDLLAIQALEEM
ncbi:MAG: arginine--tRNA ligase [Acidobacteriota bacterium]